jgi:putative PIN family toxin of toxin-antitoxin system
VIRAVFDTNVLASGAIAIAGPVTALIDAWRRGEVEIVVSSRILGELDRTLSNAYFVARLDADTRDAFLTLTRTAATVVAITTPIPSVGSTLDDNLVLATAESAGVPYLVTGDAELLRIGQYKCTVILSPRQLHDLLETGAPGTN